MFERPCERTHTDEGAIENLVFALALTTTTIPAQSRSLHVTGIAGYLSQWELDGDVADAGGSKGGGELVGRLARGPLQREWPTGKTRQYSDQAFCFVQGCRDDLLRWRSLHV